MKLQEHKGRYHLTIPTRLVNTFRWRKGSELDIVIDNKGNKIIEEVKKE